MNCIQISKEDGTTYPLYFTDTELEQIYCFVENRNLEEGIKPSAKLTIEKGN